MERHIKTFNSHEEYLEFIMSGNVLYPNVSICEDEYESYYNDNGTIDKAHTIKYILNIYDDNSFPPQLVDTIEFNSANELCNYILPGLSAFTPEEEYQYNNYWGGTLYVYNDNRKPNFFIPLTIGEEPEHDWDYDYLINLTINEGNNITNSSYQIMSYIKDYLNSQPGVEKVFNLAVYQSNFDINCVLKCVSGDTLLMTEMISGIINNDGLFGYYFERPRDSYTYTYFNFGTYEGEDIVIVFSGNSSDEMTLNDYFDDMGWPKSKVEAIKEAMINKAIDDKEVVVEVEYDIRPYMIEIYVSNNGSETYDINSCTFYSAYTFDTADELLDANLGYEFGLGSWGWNNDDNDNIDNMDFVGWFDGFNPSNYDSSNSYIYINEGNSIREFIEGAPSDFIDYLTLSLKTYLLNAPQYKTLQCFVSEAPISANYRLIFEGSLSYTIPLNSPSDLENVQIPDYNGAFNLGNVEVSLNDGSYTFVEYNGSTTSTTYYVLEYNANDNFVNPKYTYYENGVYVENGILDLTSSENAGILECIEDYLEANNEIHIYVTRIL